MCDAPRRGVDVWHEMCYHRTDVTSLQGKRVACLVTHLFPPGWGGNQTIRQMKETCESKGATVCGSGSVSWFPLGRQRRIAEVVDDLSSLS